MGADDDKDEGSDDGLDSLDEGEGSDTDESEEDGGHASEDLALHGGAGVATLHGLYAGREGKRAHARLFHAHDHDTYI